MTDENDTPPVPEAEDIPIPETGDNHSGASDDMPEWGKHLSARVDSLHEAVHTRHETTGHHHPETPPESHEDAPEEAHGDSAEEREDETPRKPPWTHRKPWKRD